jgi:hypothetical protein
MDTAVTLFAVALSAVTTVLFGLLPAWRAGIRPGSAATFVRPKTHCFSTPLRVADGWSCPICYCPHEVPGNWRIRRACRPERQPMAVNTDLFRLVFPFPRRRICQPPARSQKPRQASGFSPSSSRPAQLSKQP